MSMETHLANSADAHHSRDIGIGIAVAIVTALLGGFICAQIVHRFGEIGAFIFLLLGWVAGLAARKLMTRPRKLAGYMVAAAVILAMLISQVSWIRWNIEDVDSWGEAISLLPTFCKEFQMSALIAALCGIFGASSAYREAGVRYRLVQVVEE